MNKKINLMKSSYRKQTWCCREPIIYFYKRSQRIIEHGTKFSEVKNHLRHPANEKKIAVMKTRHRKKKSSQITTTQNTQEVSIL